MRGSVEDNKALKRFGDRVGYTEEDLKHFEAGDPRVRQMERLGRAAARYSIQAEVVKARNCNSGYQAGDKFILDVDGNFITKLCPAQTVCLRHLAIGGAGGPHQRAPRAKGWTPTSFISCIRSAAWTWASNAAAMVR